MNKEKYYQFTREIIQDPVIASDGHTYERYAIEKWMEKNSE